MVIVSSKYSYFSSRNVQVYTFRLQFINFLPNHTTNMVQPIKLDSMNKEFEIQCNSRYYIKNYQTQITIIELRFNCYRYFDRVESRMLSIEDPTKNQVQKIDKVKPEEWFSFAKINYEDFKGDATLFFEFYFYSPEITTLSTTLYDLMKSELFSDVTIVSSDGKTFNAHKNILSLKSNVFKAHLVHDCKEKTNSQILSTFDAEVIKELLAYIYTESVSNLDALSIKLLEAADFYNLEDLKSICELYLCQQLTVDNAIEMYKLADLHSVSNLKRFALRFIQINGKKITESPTWTDFEPSESMKELLYFLLQN